MRKGKVHAQLHTAIAGELVDLVASGRSLDEDDYDRLTAREKQVFKLLAEGKTSREAFKPTRALLVGGEGIPLEEFLSQPVEHWLQV